MRRIYLLALLILAPNILGQQLIQSDETFEWGAGTLSFRGAHYRGSDQERNWFLPLPYFTYTSKRIQAEPSFVRGTFYENDFFALKLSILAGLNVESEENLARRGMPSLDYTFEVGPMAIFKLWTSPSQNFSVTLEAPFRMVNTTDLTYVKHTGYFSVPYLNLRSRPLKSLYDWAFEASVAYMWGSKDFHDHFYGVAPQYATAARGSYQGRAGYSGTQLTLILNRRYKDVVMVPFIRHDFLGDVAFDDSPLFKKKSYTVGGLAFFWLFGNSL
ncbi:MAG: MipA/OmpV family protein [Bdellovibrionota bacterium]|nr:MipA/OmpV family protein [Bdellovibrionota bacterium]